VRLMLDTNIWSRLAEQGQQYPFVKLVKDKQVDVVMPPATLLEVLRTQDRQTRRAVTRLVCRNGWQRLKTEAQSEAAEIVGEIRRLRPSWMLDQPNYRRVAELEHYWRNTIYDLARSDSRRLRTLNQTIGAPERKAISELQEFQRRQFQADGVFRSLEEARDQLRTIVVQPDPRVFNTAQAEGWEPGTQVAPWRVHLLGAQWKALVLDPIRTVITGQAATYADWVGAYVDLEAIRASRYDFGHMLLYEVDEKHMPRAWLRLAIAFVQHSMRLGPGNPVDAQLASYLVDADLFATNDKRFAKIIEAVRPNSLTTYAAAAYADIHGSGGSAVMAVSAML
jgi:hypothetical protein